MREARVLRPVFSGPIRPLDPHANPEGFIRLLSELYYAEAEALRGFELLDDPTFVRQTVSFHKAKEMFCRDEAAHLADFERVIAMLGGDGPMPMTPESAEFWAWGERFRAGELSTLPVKAGVIGVFNLIGEGVGFVALNYLEQAVTDPEIAAVFAANVADETRHVALAMSLVRRAIRHEPGFALEAAVNLVGFLISLKTPARSFQKMVADLGIDHHMLASAATRYVRDLFVQVLVDEGKLPARFVPASTAMADLATSPTAMRLLQILLYLPEPPWLRPALHGFEKVRAFGANLRESRMQRARA